MDNYLNLQIKNNLSELKIVAQAFDNFKNFHHLPVKVSNAIDLALDEILNNIILYGYQDQDRHIIDIHISLEKDYIILEIEDDGKEFNPLETPKPDIESPINKRPVGGLGIHLTRNLMDEINYSYENKRNSLLMKKKLKRG